MNRRQLLGSLGAFAATLALPHAGWALDWPSEAIPLKKWWRKDVTLWLCVNAHKETLPVRWSEEISALLPQQKAGDAYISFRGFFDKPEAQEWSYSRHASGYKALAIVESGTTVRPPKLFNGRYGGVFIVNDELIQAPFSAISPANPLRATWYEGQGL